ncbi:MAG TPA: site-2 protease family protein [Gemmatimonadales bacterium]|nr:site-2 protease family protein [Gemmatimonadales bacterium]
MPDLADGLVYYLVFLFSTTLHEAAHAWAARRGGDSTAYHGGQVSLSPLPHIRREPIGMVLLPLLSVVATGFPLGFASAPYDRRWAARHPTRAAWMALAGPGANIALLLLAGLLLRAGEVGGLFYAPDSVRFGEVAGTTAGGLWPAVAFMLGVLFSENLLLAAFNLLPLPPLDGSGALPLLLSEQRSRAYQEFLWSTPAIQMMGLFVAWQVFDVLFDPIFVQAVSLLYPGVSYH